MEAYSDDDAVERTGAGPEGAGARGAESEDGDGEGEHACPEPAGSDRPPPTPRVVQPWLVPFRVWRDRYAYFVDCMLGNIMTSLRNSLPAAGGTTFDRPGMRHALEHYLYRTSHNRFKSFVQLGGPRPPRCCTCYSVRWQASQENNRKI